MTDMIRSLIANIAPEITGGSTLADVVTAIDAIPAAPGGGSSTADPAVLTALAAIGDKLDWANTQSGYTVERLAETVALLTAIDLKLAAVDQIGDIVAAVNEVNVTVQRVTDIDVKLGEYLPYLETINIAAEANNTLVGTLSSSIGDIETAVLSGNTLSVEGNSLLSDISINIGSGNTISTDIVTAINTMDSNVRDDIIATSGSIRGEIVALTLQDASNHGASQAQLITIAEQSGLTRVAIETAQAAIEAAIQIQTDQLETQIGDSRGFIIEAIQSQTAAIDALFDEFIGLSYSGSDPEPVRVASWLQRLDDKLAPIAAEFGWGQ